MKDKTKNWTTYAIVVVLAMLLGGLITYGCFPQTIVETKIVEKPVIKEVIKEVIVEKPVFTNKCFCASNNPTSVAEAKSIRNNEPTACAKAHDRSLC